MPRETEQLGKGYRQLLELIERERDLDFSQWRPGCLMRRIDHRVRTSGAGSLGSYLQLLQRMPDELNRLLDDMTIGVTEFFRNPEVFEALSQRVVPEVIRQAIEEGYPRIRCWCAGTSNGAEAFTLAILFSEEFARIGRQVPIAIQATDIDRSALAEAEAGRYSTQMMKDVPAPILAKYFTKATEGYAVADSIRLLVKFRYHDMIRGKPLMANDLIVCRNVLIYFSKELQQRVVDNFWKGLRQGGYLVLGQTESIHGGGERFRVVDPSMHLYVKG